MKIAISTLLIKDNDIEGNVQKIINKIEEISSQETVDMILFPEDCFTGLSNCDIPEVDIKLGRSLESYEINKIKAISRKTKTFVSFGFLELFNNKLFDSVVIVDHSGKLIFIHRRTHNGWYNPKMQNDFYGLGSTISKVDTELGSFAVLICGEITDKNTLRKITNLKSDFLLFPLLRASENYPTEKWLNEEMEYYSKQLAKTGTLTFMVNGLIPYKKEIFFGGAWVISPKGKILKSMKIFYEGYIVYDTKQQLLEKEIYRI